MQMANPSSCHSLSTYFAFLSKWIFNPQGSSFKFEIIKQQTFGTKSGGSRGLIEFSDARKKWTNHLRTQVEVEINSNLFEKKTTLRDMTKNF